MNDSYKIIISISHHRISFEYYLKGGDDVLVPLPPGNWPAPLAFYCSPTGIIIGEDAARAAQSGVANAFINYFDLLPQSDLFYEIGGERRPIGKMLLDASETIFRDFFSTILLNRKGDLNDNRLNMPLTIVCEADIKSNERVYVNNTFKDSGYDKVLVVNYDTYIDKYIKNTLSKEYLCDKVLVVWTEGGDLSLTLFDAKGTKSPKSKIYPKLGIDPRLNFVMDVIWSNVSGQNPWLNRDEENPVIRKVALDFLNSTSPLVNDYIQLSDGMRYSYNLLRSNIDYIQSNESVALKKGVQDFLQENAIDDKGSVLLLLRGVAAGNTYFESNLRNGFAGVVRSDKELRSKTMKLIISSTDIPKITDPDIPTLPRRDIPAKPTGRENRRYKELEMSVNTHLSNNRFSLAENEIEQFLSDMHAKNIIAFDEQINRLKSQVAKEAGPSQQGMPKQVPELEITEYQPSGRDKRDFREIKALAKSAFEGGDMKRAIQILSKFKDEMSSKKIVAFNDEIQTILESYKNSTYSTSSKNSAGSPKAFAIEDTEKESKVATSKDHRDFRILQKGVESKLSQGDINAAKDLIKAFISDMHKKGIFSFDNELKTLNDKIRQIKK